MGPAGAGKSAGHRDRSPSRRDGAIRDMRGSRRATATGLSVGSPSVLDVLPFENLIPPEMMSMSGSVYYSGRDAFTGPSPLYILGLNPGGDPMASSADTVETHLGWARPLPARWSAYRDQSWAGRPAGTAGLQPRVLHLLDRLGLDPSDVPSSNLVFVRSTREATMGDGLMGSYADDCWPFHAAAIKSLGVRVVLCLGGTVGGYVRERLAAKREIGTFVEANKRRWTSRTHEGASGVRVVTAAHPSIADWTKPSTDISDLVAAALAQ